MKQSEFLKECVDEIAAKKLKEALELIRSVMSMETPELPYLPIPAGLLVQQIANIQDRINTRHDKEEEAEYWAQMRCASNE